MYSKNGMVENTILQLLAVIFILVGLFASAWLLKKTTDETTTAIETNGNNTIEIMDATKDKMIQILS